MKYFVTIILAMALLASLLFVSGKKDELFGKDEESDLKENVESAEESGTGASLDPDLEFPQNPGEQEPVADEQNPDNELNGDSVEVEPENPEDVDSIIDVVDETEAETPPPVDPTNPEEPGM